MKATNLIGRQLDVNTCEVGHIYSMINTILVSMYVCMYVCMCDHMPQ